MIKKILLIFTMIGILLSGCNEEPTDIGINLLQDTIIVNAISSDTLDIMTGFEVYKQNAPMFNSGAILVGNTPNTESFALLRFSSIPDSLAYLTANDIESCKVFMTPNNYAFGDFKNDFLSFEVKKVTNYWTNETKYEEIANNKPAYFNDQIVANWQGNIELKDSIPPISFDLSKDLVVDWFKTQQNNADTNNVQDTIWGIALLPKVESNVVQRFNGIGNPDDGETTSLEIIYNNSDDELDTLILYTGIEYSLMNAPDVSGDDMVIQGGVSYRTKLNFDVSMLPDLASIHKSELILNYNPDLSVWGSYGPDSIIALRLYDDIDPDDYSTSPILEWSADLQEATTQYKFESISSAIETWNRTEDKKGSIVLLALPTEQEYRQLDRMAFYGPNSEKQELRPKIRIIYSYIEENSK